MREFHSGLVMVVVAATGILASWCIPKPPELAKKGAAAEGEGYSP